jgi:hypothetical protein
MARRQKAGKPGERVEKLALLAAEHGFERPLLMDILWRTQAYPGLIGFREVALNMWRSIDLMDGEMDIDEYEVRDWLPLLEWAATADLSEIYQDSSEVDKAPRPRTLQPSYANPLVGCAATSNPVYTSLWHEHTRADERNRYAMAQGQLLLTYAKRVKMKSRVEAYESYLYRGLPFSIYDYSPYSCALAMRYLSSSEDSPMELLQQLPVTLPPKEFAEEIQWVQVPDSVDLMRRFAGMQRYLLLAHGSIAYKRKSSRGGTGNQDSPYRGEEREDSITGSVSLDLSNPHATEAISIPCLRVPGRAWSGSSIDTSERSEDSSEYEDLAAEDIFLSSDPEQNNEESARLIDLSRAQMRVLGRPYHLMPWANGALTDTELRPIFARALELLKPHASPDRDELRNLCLLLASLLTGHSVEECADARVSLPGCMNSPSTMTFFLGAKDRIRMRTIAPKYTKQANELPSRVYKPAEFLFLEMSSILARLLHLLMGDQIEQPLKKNSQQKMLLLVTAKHGLMDSVRATLASLDKTKRLTAARIRDTLAGRILAASGGDIALASLVTCTKHPLAVVELFYDGISIAEAQEVYNRAIGSMEQGCLPQKEWTSRTAPASDPNRLSKGYIGCRYTPPQATVREAIEAVKQKARAILPLRNRTIRAPFSPAFIQAHNFYTLYVVLWLGYACGIRAITTPLVRSRDVDFETGLCNYADKDNKQGYKSRLLWVPPELLEEIVRYERHLARFSPSWRRNAGVSRVAGFFLEESSEAVLKEGNQAVLIRPTSIRDRDWQLKDLPANTHRRVMKQELRRANCPPEFIRAWMGHWTIEQEPWSDLSGLSMQRARNCFQEFIPPLLDSLGFSALRQRWMQTEAD